MKCLARVVLLQLNTHLRLLKTEEILFRRFNAHLTDVAKTVVFYRVYQSVDYVSLMMVFKRILKFLHISYFIICCIYIITSLFLRYIENCSQIYDLH